ncbi:MAG: hypothetical protein A2017_13640 [Lentisphaerae bacterium GWF2_44_16]|nr:MAG: hypothetical protein A2017_13640 [Lentisphaerae bacterium GWF2_44_16]
MEKKKWFQWGCITVASVAASALVIFLLWYFLVYGKSGTTPPEFIKQAAPQIEQKQEDVSKKKQKEAAAREEQLPNYDLDQTVMGLFSIEQALQKAKNFEELTPFILQKESDLVAPEILELKYRFFNIYKKLLQSKDELEEMNSIYNVTSGSLLDLISTVDYTKFSLDHEQAMKIWEKRLNSSKLRDEVKNRISTYQDEMINFYFDYLKTSAEYLKKWDKMCSFRDRAYLAAYESNWPEVIKNAGAAIKLAPYEKEAHILLPMAMLEKGGETDSAAAKTLIDEYLKLHQGQDAPAYLLRGVINLKNGNFDSAIIDFDQSAAYYPKQQEALLDRMNLYKKRNFLNKSKEGRMILNIYWGIMSGAGYFSPDFQKARACLEKGEKDNARTKIFDHFFRRRMQGQWDKVLADFQYCNKFLNTALHDINGGEQLNLSVEPAFFTNSVVVTITNNSNKDIHNMTVLLCVRFTDMFQGDYISFPVGDTVALLKAGESVTVGRKNINDITKEKLGSVKKFKDIIDYAAVIISDETITWLSSKPAMPPPEEKIENMDQLKRKIAKDVVNVVIDAVTNKDTPAEENTRKKQIADELTDILINKLSGVPENEADKAKAEDIKRKLIKDIADIAVDMIRRKMAEEKASGHSVGDYMDKAKKYVKDMSDSFFSGKKTQEPATEKTQEKTPDTTSGEKTEK